MSCGWRNKVFVSHPSCFVFQPSCFVYILYPFYSAPPPWTLSSIFSFKTILCTNWLLIEVWTAADWLESTPLELSQSTVSLSIPNIWNLDRSHSSVCCVSRAWASSLACLTHMTAKPNPTQGGGLGGRIGEMSNFFPNCPIQSTNGCWPRS